MKVSELITMLERRDPDAMVVISAIEGGADECQTVLGVKLLLNENTKKNWLPNRGAHEIIFKGPKKFKENPAESEGVLLQ